MDFKSIIQHIVSKIGGNIKDKEAIDTSINGFNSSFDPIPLEYFDNPSNQGLDQLFSAVVDKSRIDFLEKYAIIEKDEAIALEKKINSLDREKDQMTFMGLINKLSRTSERLLKIHNLLVGQLSNVVFESITMQKEAKDHIQKIINISREGAITPLNNIIRQEDKVIQELPEKPESQERLDLHRDMLDMIGLLNKQLAGSIEKKERSIPVDKNLTIKRKKRIIARLIRSINISQLPALANRKIQVPGDYFKLFKALERKNEPWMDLALQKYVFGTSRPKYDEFNRVARQSESPEEEDQLVYLNASRSWILSYTKSIKDGELDVRSEQNYVTRLEEVVSEKNKEIKNYYLSRDFNLGNFGGISLTPEIKLPLYTSIKLAVSEKDRIKESPLRNLLSGVGNILKGLIGDQPDNGDEAFAQRARKRNLAVWSGITQLAKGSASLVAGKQAGRSVEKIMTPKDDSIKEDMLAVGDTGDGGAPIMNPDIAPAVPPGQDFQTPDAIATGMDKMALAGPGKKKKEERKKPKTIISFDDFIKSKSKKF